MLLGRGVKRVCRFLRGAPVLKEVDHGASFQSVAVAVPTNTLEATRRLINWRGRARAVRGGWQGASDAHTRMGLKGASNAARRREMLLSSGWQPLLFYEMASKGMVLEI